MWIRSQYSGHMAGTAKTTQLQIRLTHAEKSAMQRAARCAGMDLSAYVLSRVQSAPAVEFARCLDGCDELESARFALADLNALLSKLTAGELTDAVQSPPATGLSRELENYVAAMVEHACAHADIPIPRWTSNVPPLSNPIFGSTLLSLRLYLLTHSPPAFRRRNVFIDATLGAQV